MPFEWVAPPVHLEHKGVSVYTIFKDDDIENGPIRTYSFGLSEGCSDCGEMCGEFDVRKLAEYEGDIDQAIKDAIDAGKLKNEF